MAEHSDLQYCIYLRKSRADAEAEAHGEGETLARHEKALLELARRKHLAIAKIYREVVSGETIASRPVMQRLLLEVEKGLWAGVFVMEIERLARGDTIDQGIMAQTFKLSDTKIITPIKTYDPNNEFDEEYFEFGLFMSRREYKAINRRLQRGRLASVNEGKFVGNKEPYGYKRVKLQREKGWTLEPIQEEAETVELIFALYTKGLEMSDGSKQRIGASRIAERLNQLRIPSKTGGLWGPSSVRDILSNPVYTGKIRWNYRPGAKHMAGGHILTERPRRPESCIISEGRHPPIINEATFALAQQQLLSSPPNPLGRERTVKNSLSGIVVCGVCGRKMIRRPGSQGDKKDVLMCSSSGCSNVSSYLSLIEDRLLEALSGWLEGYVLPWESTAQEVSSPSYTVKQKAIKRIEAELAILDKQEAALHDLLEQGIYSVEVYLERTRLLTQQKQVLKRTAGEIASEFAWEPVPCDKKHTNILDTGNIMDVYRLLPTAQAKNIYLKAILEKVIYRKAHSGRWKGAPDNFELILYPKLPPYS